MHIDRRVERKHQAKSGRIGVKKRDMKLPKEKAEQLAKSLRERGLWSWDDDWPKDEEDCIDIRPISIYKYFSVRFAEPPQEIWYYPNMAKEYSRVDTTSESTSLKITHDQVDAATLQGLISETGILSAGVLPHLDVATTDGEKNMAASLATGAVAKPKKAAKNKDTVPVVEQTWKERGS